MSQPKFADFNTLKKFVEDNPERVSMNQVLWACRKRHENGATGVFVKFGAKWMVNEPAFVHWLLNKDKDVAA